MKITLGENINKYRKEKNMTQEDLALALGVTFAFNHGDGKYLWCIC